MPPLGKKRLTVQDHPRTRPALSEHPRRAKHAAGRERGPETPTGSGVNSPGSQAREWALI